jgi:hypothetical protein
VVGVLLLLTPMLGLNYYIDKPRKWCAWYWKPVADFIGCPEPPAAVSAEGRSEQTTNASASTLADPRSELFKGMGIVYSEKNFWDAVKGGDDRATVLFLRGGMTIISLGMHEVLIDPQLVAKAPLRRLTEYADGRNNEFCSSDDEAGPSKLPIPNHRTILRFGQYAKNDTAVAFLRSFCKDHDIISSLNRRLAIELEALAATKAANERNSRGYRACMDRYKKLICLFLWKYSLIQRGPQMSGVMMPTTVHIIVLR